MTERKSILLMAAYLQIEKTRIMLIFHNCFYKAEQDFAAIVPIFQETPRSVWRGKQW